MSRSRSDRQPRDSARPAGPGRPAPGRRRDEEGRLDIVSGADLPQPQGGTPHAPAVDDVPGRGGPGARRRDQRPRVVRDADAPGRAARPEQLATTVLEEMDQAVVAVDGQWRVTRWNAAAERMGHVSRRTVLGRSIWELWPALRGTDLERALRGTMRRREVREVRQWYDRSRFGGRVLDVRSHPLDDDGILVIFAETSGRLREQREWMATAEENLLLMQLAGRLADTPDSSALFAVLCETAERECDASGACISAIAGDELRVLSSRGTGLCTEGHVAPLAGSTAERAMRTRSLVRERAQPSGDAPRGPFIPGAVVEAMTVPLVAHGDVMGVLTVVRGLGEPPFMRQHERRLRLVADHAALALWKSRVLEQALAANEAKSTFLATMSHELRTPLTALTGYGELLADGILGPLSDDQAETVERMRSVTQGLSAIIDELLTFSSLDSGREQLRMAEVASGDLMRAAAAAVVPTAHRKGLLVEVRVPPDAPLVTTDPEKARQALGNLAANAVKFTDEGVVTFAVASDRAEVRFLVKDTGLGIAPEDVERIFQPFVQLDSGLTRRHGGTGVGLYMTSRLAALLGGRMEVDSTPGSGSRFMLVLPRHPGVDSGT